MWSYEAKYKPQFVTWMKFKGILVYNIKTNLFKLQIEFIFLDDAVTDGI